MKFIEFTPANVDTASNDQLEKLHAAFEGEAHETWQELAISNFALLRSLPELKKITDEALCTSSVALVYQLAKIFGGNQIYIANGAHISRREAAAQIAKAFRGNNIRALAKQHGVSENRIRQIVQEDALLSRQSSQSTTTR